jgi:mannose-6-phosphate isomerase-like protein (cupin superfamily)
VKTLADAPVLDIFDQAFLSDPPAVMRPLRAETWIAQTPIGGLVIGRAQVQALIGDRPLRSSLPDMLRLQGITEGPLFDRLSSSILALEGEEHQRIRRLVNRAFTPRAVDVHRPHMRSVLDDLIGPLLPTGRSDLMPDLCDHYPIRVMCHVLGVPEEDHEDFASWNRAITWALSFEVGAHLDEVTWGMSQMDSYVSELMADRRRHPREDLVTALVQAREGEAPIAPKALAGPLHTHHNEDALWYVIDGEFGAQVGEQDIHEGPGALIFAPLGIPHTYWNPGSTPARYLEMAWPAGLERYLERLGRMVSSGSNDLLSEVADLSEEFGVEMHWDSIAALMDRHGVGFAL